MVKRLIAVLCLGFAGAVVTPALCAAQSASQHAWTPSSTATTRPQVLVLGVYHMANPDKDIADAHASNVLGPKRQAQIKRVVAVLKRFRPTKIAVEAKPGDPRLALDYANYLAGKHALNRNEIEQLGFRIAKESGLKAVYGVDAPHNFPFKRVQQYAQENDQSQELNAITTKLKTLAKEITAYLGTHTVLQTLIRMNADANVAKQVGYYYVTAHLSKPGNWAGADLVSVWFQRNMRIYANVVHLIDSPHDRILVIIGDGHLGWLRHDFASDPTIRLRKLAEFVN